MHLLHTGTRQLRNFEGSEIPPYAILSHVWGSEEVTFEQIQNPPSGGGLDKINGACSMARSHGFDYVWVDTCCINKNSSAELSEALNSMYRWYQDSAVCYAYLADVASDTAVTEHPSQATHSEFSQSKWFTRGWTLQELIAPSLVIFFNKTWQEIGTKSSLQATISGITGIPDAILRGDGIENASIAQRMSWASQRVTKRAEDLAYCLMGIFGVNMTMLYGEGPKAFMRLQEEIMKTSDDHSLFAWESAMGDGGLLAPSPAAFSGSHKIIPANSSDTLSGAITINNKGVHVTLRFMDIDRLPSQRVQLAILPCAVQGNAKMKVGIFLKDQFATKKYFTRTKTQRLELVDLQEPDRVAYTVADVCVQPGRRFPKRASGLARAATNGHAPTVRLLLERSHGTDTIDTNDLQSAMELAAKNGHDAVVELLLENDLTVDLALSWASQNGHETVVELLLEEPTNPMALRQSVDWAAVKGHAAVVKQLLERGAGDISGLLYLAAECGHEEVVKLLLERQADPERLELAFIAAAQNGHVAVVDLLFARDIDFQALQTALESAASHGHETVVKLLLKTDVGSEVLESVLELAVSSGYAAVVKLVLEKHVPYPALKSALNSAAGHGHKAVVELLLTKDFDSQALRSALEMAVESGREEVVEVLLEKNIGFSAVGYVLQSAASRGDYPVVKSLLRKDLSSKVLSEALMLAIDDGHEAVAELLLNENIDADTLESAFQTASSKGQEELVKFLLERNVNSGFAFGAAMMSAAEHGHGAVIKLLLKEDVDIESVGSALKLAASNGHDAEVKLLVESGNVRSWAVTSALNSAVRFGHMAVVKSLLERAISPDGLKSAMEQAARLGHEDMAMLLLERHAEVRHFGF